MPMSPRLLRPRASGDFDPRTISGCIFNLDASVLSSLRQNSDGTTAAAATNDPVGYAEDLSGLGNHARQSVATGSRPFLQLNNQNGRPGLLFDGSNDWLTASIAGFQSLSNVTVLQVFKAAVAAAADTNSAAFWGFGNVGTAGGSFPANSGLTATSSTGIFSGERFVVAFDPGNLTGRLGASGYLRPASTAQLLAVAAGSGGTALYSNNSQVSLNLASGITTTTASGPSGTNYTLDNDLHICGLRANGTIAVSPEITLHQMIVYNRVLTAAELTTIWNAMRGKWGITPYSPPTYADADVNAYITAVETADGGVALETGVRDAINTFITGCKTDNIWSAIKASCILMGARTLSGALTPLVGSAPTNENFVSGDYNRRTGLLGDNSTKRILTNRAEDADPLNSNHYATYASTISAGNLFLNGDILTGVATTSISAAATRNRNVSADLFTATTGFNGISRSASASYSRRNNAVTTTVATASDAAVSGTTTSRVNSGSHRVAFYSQGESLTLSLLDSRVTTLYTAIGAAIP